MQAGAVSFFPTHYLNEISQPPLAEYLMLHSYILSGSDRYVNLVQFFGFLGSVVGVSLVAQTMGGAIRAQLIASLFCATIPNGILQASGAKNDYLLSLWLVAMVHFALRFCKSASASGDLLWAGISLGLAWMTKATAYLFAPPLLLGLWAGTHADKRQMPLRPVVILLLCAIGLNLPQYWRNLSLSGSPLGFDAPFADERFRWTNEAIGVRPTASNVLRSLSDHLGARSHAWNEGVYRLVVQIHRAFAMDAQDPATTWQWSRYEPPQTSNHEANAANRWHLLILSIGLVFAWLSPARRSLLGIFAGILVGFLLLCAILKWQPYMVRLHLPLFVMGSAVVGVLVEHLKPVLLQALLCTFLLNNSRPFVTQNWLRPLIGPKSILKTARQDQYFADIGTASEPAWYRRATSLTLRSGCSIVGIDNE